MEPEQVSPQNAPVAVSPVPATAEEASACATTAFTNLPGTTPTTSSKRIHTLVIDTAPLIKNDPPVSSLLAQADVLVTVPAVLDEVRDAATRARVDTTLRPFLTLRTPKPTSIKFVSDFSRRTGDLEVLSRPDLHLLALSYEIECERNGGDGRLRRTPAQQKLNSQTAEQAASPGVGESATEAVVAESGTEATATAPAEATQSTSEAEQHGQQDNQVPQGQQQPQTTLESKVEELSLAEPLAEHSAEPAQSLEARPETPVEEGTPQQEKGENGDGLEDSTDGATEEEEAEEDDDSGGEWITPSNLKKHQAKDRSGAAPTQPIPTRLEVALLTGDFAMQNVALRINLYVLSPSAATNSGGGAGLARVTQVRTWVLRCYGCFQVTRQMTKRFCPACGQATLTRTSCSTDAATGQFRLHLKRNFQYNKRGNIFSVPKPVHGSASGKYTDAMKKSGGGGAHGWGRNLVLSEDQREYTRQVEETQRHRVRDLMDEDYLPSLLTGSRTGAQGSRIRVGAGRNVNAKKRR